MPPDEGPPTLRPGHVQQVGAVASQACVAGDAGPPCLPRPSLKEAAPELLVAAAADVAGCLGAQATQAAAVGGGPDVKDNKPSHLCRHRWVIWWGSQTAKLTARCKCWPGHTSGCKVRRDSSGASLACSPLSNLFPPSPFSALWSGVWHYGLRAGSIPPVFCAGFSFLGELTACFGFWLFGCRGRVGVRSSGLCFLCLLAVADSLLLAALGFVALWVLRRFRLHRPSCLPTQFLSRLR